MTSIVKFFNCIKTGNTVLRQATFNFSIPTLTWNRSFHNTETRNGFRSKSHAPMLMAFKKRADYLKEKGLYPVSIRSTFLEWNYDSELYAFGKRFNEEFDDQLLREALTDASYIAQETQRLKDIGVESPQLEMKSNKDLSTAGKALIGDFCLKFLRVSYPLLPEEAIESFTEYLTSDEVLGRVAQQLGFQDLILTKEYPPSEATFARSFSAVVGCLNVSSGLARCHQFILDIVVAQLIGKDLWDIWQIDDPFFVIEGILARSGKGEPEPRLIGDIGRNTIESVFHVGIYDGNKELIGKGYGETVVVGIKLAAFDALSRMFDQTIARSPLPLEEQDSILRLKAEPNTSLNQWTLNREVVKYR